MYFVIILELHLTPFKVAIKAGVKVDVKAVAAVLVKIKVVLVACIADLKVLAKLKFEDIICGEDGVALKVEVFAALCVKLILVSMVNCSLMAVAYILWFAVPR